MEFRLLGPVEVHAYGRTIELGRPQQRLVLAILLAEAGRQMSTQTLIDRVWDSAEEGARRRLHVHITRLRKLLPPGQLVSVSGGYRLEVAPEQIDLHRFRQLLADARGANGAETDRAARLRSAMGLWRGEPLAGLPGPWAARTRTAWQREYVEAALLWARAETRAGDPAGVVGSLTELVAQHPLVEPLVAELMRALHRAGRTADALDLYAATRRLLADELGIDPGPDLRETHRAILRSDTGPAPTGPALTEPAPAKPEQTRAVPRQLPAPPQVFTGRAAEADTLLAAHDATTVVINAVDGMAGIGKTALAVHVAHRVAGRYPDGQMFIDLHGHTPGVAPAEPCEALAHALRSLDVPGSRIPPSVDERAALYRTLLADRRMLIVLDNAAAESQVQPLLPGAPGCLVLITSRRRLHGLNSSRTLSLDTLPVADAVAMFTRVAGADRLAGEPAPLLTELVERCGRLPLAIRVSAARLRSHPTWPLSRLVTAEPRQRPPDRVTAALDLSYRDLDGRLQRAYRLLGLAPGADLDAYAAAALVDGTVPDATGLLDHLLDVHLIHEPAPGRYRFHDLTRAHAAMLGRADPAGDAAVGRLLDFYRHTAALAVDVAYPYESEGRPRVPAAATPRPGFDGPASALEWLDAELPNLMTAHRHAGENGRSDHVLHLSTILHRHLRSRGRYDDAGALHRRALAVARATGRRAAEADALNDLGHLLRLRDDRIAATEHYREAARIAQDSGHRRGAVDALIGLGHLQVRLAEHATAAGHYERALELARRCGYRAGELEAAHGLGNVYRFQGNVGEAARHYEQALRIARATGHRSGELNALHGLGSVERLEGLPDRAVEHFRLALGIAEETGHRYGELIALTGLGGIERERGRYEEAAGHYRQLLDLARECGSGNYEFEARQGLGRQQSATGAHRAALSHHERALMLARRLGQPVDEARAHDGLAHAHHALHDGEQARRHWRQALRILTELGLDHTDEPGTTASAIRARLAG